MEDTQALLRAWREAEAALDAAEPGTPAWDRAVRALEAAHEAYHRHIATLGDEAADLGHDPRRPPSER